MAKPLPQETRDMAKALYLQGVRPKIIAQKLHIGQDVISKWQNRGKWGQSVDIMKKLVAETGDDDLTIQMAKQSIAIRETLATDLALSSSKLPKHSAELNKFHKRQASLGQLISNAATVFGWQTGNNSQAQVNIAVLTVKPDISAQIQAKCDVIDVQHEPEKESLVTEVDSQLPDQGTPPSDGGGS